MAGHLDLLLIAGITIFVILAAIVYKVIDEISVFTGPVAFVLSICTAGLCLIGMFEFFQDGHAVTGQVAAESQEPRGFVVVLLPCVSLVLTILLLPVVLLLVWIIAKLRGYSEYVRRRRWEERR